MATYKVIQDIEAEDKLLGPLTLRQFIYAGIVIVSGFVAFQLAQVQWWLALPFIPHTVLFGFLAAPIGQDQSSEIWLLAKIRFMLKPRRRIWDQTGIQQLVTITAPKRIERVLTDNLSQTEVRSRLQALANTIDSRGWAVKNVDVNLYSQPSYLLGQNQSDRLINLGNMPQEVKNYDITAADDMLDEKNNPTAQSFDQMIQQQTQTQRQHFQAVASGEEKLPAHQPPPANYWFLNQGASPTKPGQAAFQPAVVAPGTQESARVKNNETEAAIAKELKAKAKTDPAHERMHRIKPKQDQKKDAPSASQASTPAPDPAIIDLAYRKDLYVDTVARMANKARQQEPPENEVVISLR